MQKTGPKNIVVYLSLGKHYKGLYRICPTKPTDYTDHIDYQIGLKDGL